MDDRDIRIVEAVRRAMNDFGIRRFTVADVARGADVSRQTVYERFGNRDALVTAALASGARDLVSRSAAAAPPGADPAERLEAAFAATLAFLQDSPLWASPEKRAELVPYVTVAGGVFLSAASQALLTVLRGWYPDAAGVQLAACADLAVRTLVSHGLSADHAPGQVARGLARTIHPSLG